MNSKHIPLVYPGGGERVDDVDFMMRMLLKYPVLQLLQRIQDYIEARAQGEESWASSIGFSIDAEVMAAQTIGASPRTKAFWGEKRHRLKEHVFGVARRAEGTFVSKTVMDR